MIPFANKITQPNKKFKWDSVNPRVFCKERKKSARSLRPLTKRYTLKTTK